MGGRMGNINSIVLEGNLTAAATLSHWPNGTAYARFTIAHSKSYKDTNGQWQEIVSFIDCQIRGAFAEAMTKNLLKGRHITVEGRLKQNKWKDENGNSKFAVIIKVDELSLAPGSFTPKEQPDGAAQSFKPASNNDTGYDAADYGPAPDDNYMDSDIPF